MTYHVTFRKIALLAATGWAAACNVSTAVQEGAAAKSADGQRQKILDDAFDFSQEPQLPKVDLPTDEEIRLAIDRGVDFLLSQQNEDGSWGNSDEQRPFQIYAPMPGAHHAFKTAVTGMCVSALIETGRQDSTTILAIDKGDQWLREHLARLKRATGDAIYNVWGHAYSIQALVRLHQRPGTAESTKDLYRQLIAQQLEMLDRYESVDGGWGYYDFRYQARQPTSDSISFVNATVLIAFKEAEQIGVPLNELTTKRAIAATLRQQKPDFTYLYGEYLKNSPMMGINRPAGSLGRSQACNAALRMWGDDKITDLVLKNWLYRLYVRNGWLSIGRKRPIPHEAWFQVAGYFYYYGHFYAAYCIEMLPAEQREPYRRQLARIILQYQEPEGDWWDYPMYGYHRPYGTAFALMTLDRCLPNAAQQ